MNKGPRNRIAQKLKWVIGSAEGGVEFAEGEAGDGGLFGVALGAGNELAGDGGDERVFGSAGEGLDLILRGRDHGTVVAPEVEEARLP